MNRRLAFETYDLYRGPQALGSLWSQRVGARQVYCTLFSHPHGWELMLNVNGRFERAHICRTSEEVFQIADTWRSVTTRDQPSRVA